MTPLFRLHRYGRILLLGITFVSLVKCLIFPNALDVLILVGLLLLTVLVLLNNSL
ncbi:MAG TPA: hypothetical protein VIL83_07685 [Capillibacterium sp.]